MDDKVYPLVGLLTDYHGVCDDCGAEIIEPLILASDIHRTDKYGNPLYMVIGIPERDDSLYGNFMTCKKCGHPIFFIRKYETIDVTESLAKQEARQ